MPNLKRFETVLWHVLGPDALFLCFAKEICASFSLGLMSSVNLQMEEDVVDHQSLGPLKVSPAA